MAETKPRPEDEPQDEHVQSQGADPSTEGGEPTPVDDTAEFDAGWNDGEPAAATGDDDPPHGGDTDDDPDETPAEGDEPGKAAEPPAGKEGDDAPARAEDEPPKPDDVERVKQELKTWQGRLKKAQEEAEEAERRAQEAARKAAEGQVQGQGVRDDGEGGERSGGDEQRERAAAKDRIESSLSDEEKAELSTFAEDYPDVYRNVERIAKSLVGDVDSRIRQAVDRLKSEEVEPAVQQLRQSEAQQHFAQIERKHEDWQQFVDDGSLQEWIESQPYKEAKELMDIYERGSAAKVVKLLDQFKESRSQRSGQRQPSQDQKRQQQLQASANVRPRSGGPPRASSKDDWDAGWDLG